MLFSRLTWALLFLAAFLFMRYIAPTPPRPREQVEYKQVINSDPVKLASIVRKLLPLTVTADERTGTIIFKGPPDFVAQAVATCDKLECIPNCGPPNVPFVMHLKNAKATTLASELREMVQQGLFAAEKDERPIPPPGFVADERTNSLIVKSEFTSQDPIRNLIEELDKPLK